MIYLVFLTRNEFWQEIGDFFKGIGDSLYEFWINPQANNPESEAIPYLGVFIFALVVLILGYFAIKFIIKIARKALGIDKNTFIKDRTLKRFLLNSSKYILYVILIIIFLSILGVQLTGIATIFSSAILAIGLSLQDVISNFASGLIILTSKPFAVNDYVLFNNEGVEGNVVDVKFLTTYLKTVDGQTVIIPNKNITNATITNFSSNPARRINITISVSYDSDIKLVKKTMLDAIKTDKRVLKDPAPVAYLVKFNESGLDVSLRCHVPNEVYWDMLFNFNELILKYFRKNNINIAFRRIDIFDASGKKIELDSAVNNLTYNEDSEAK